MYKRHSSLKNQIDKKRPEWGNIHAMEVPLHFDSQQSESASMRDLAICDVSVLPKLGVKGKGAAAWLNEEGIPIPNETYEWMPFDKGAMIIRLATDEFFLEDSLKSEAVVNLSGRLGWGFDGVYRVERQDTGLLISGMRAHEVLAQTCSYPFDENEEKVVMTRGSPGLLFHSSPRIKRSANISYMVQFDIRHLSLASTDRNCRGPRGKDCRGEKFTLRI